MKILAVDDEQLVLEALVDAVTEAEPGAEIHAFQSGKKALEYAETEVCEVAFLDIRLRAMTGLELALQLKMLWPNVNIIFASGYDEYVMEAMRVRASGYILKPVTVERVRDELDNLRIPLMPEKKRIHAQTFGNFELFIDGSAADFDSSRSKELLAYLIDRRGAMVTNGEIAATIWESNNNIASTQAQVRKAKANLMTALKKCKAEEILKISRYEMGVNTEKMSCDYWQLLDHDVRVLNSFRGEYMSGYSWAEPTLGSLMGEII
jgi:two-component system LytT family response regulator